jgi:ANTAR domain
MIGLDSMLAVDGRLVIRPRPRYCAPSATQESGRFFMSPRYDDVVEAMSHREVIDEAVALLREKHQVSEADAFRMLLSGSADSQDRVREVAASIVRRL